MAKLQDKREPFRLPPDWALNAQGHLYFCLNCQEYLGLLVGAASPGAE